MKEPSLSWIATPPKQDMPKEMTRLDGWEMQDIEDRSLKNTYSLLASVEAHYIYSFSISHTNTTPLVMGLFHLPFSRTMFFLCLSRIAQSYGVIQGYRVKSGAEPGNPASQSLTAFTWGPWNVILRVTYSQEKFETST